MAERELKRGGGYRHAVAVTKCFDAAHAIEDVLRGFPIIVAERTRSPRAAGEQTAIVGAARDDGGSRFQAPIQQAQTLLLEKRIASCQQGKFMRLHRFRGNLTQPLPSDGSLYRPLHQCLTNVRLKRTELWRGDTILGDREPPALSQIWQ